MVQQAEEEFNQIEPAVNIPVESNLTQRNIIQNSKRGLSILDWLGAVNNPYAFYNKVFRRSIFGQIVKIYKVYRQALQNDQNLSIKNLRLILTGIVVWFGFILKGSAQIRGWTFSFVKFIVYILTLASMLVTGSFLALKMQHNR